MKFAREGVIFIIIAWVLAAGAIYSGLFAQLVSGGTSRRFRS